MRTLGSTVSILCCLFISGCVGSEVWTANQSPAVVAAYYDSYSVSGLCTVWDAAFGPYGKPRMAKRKAVSAALVRKGQPAELCLSREYDQMKLLVGQMALNNIGYKPRYGGNAADNRALQDRLDELERVRRQREWNQMIEDRNRQIADARLLRCARGYGRNCP